MEKSFHSFIIKADGRFLKQDIQAYYSLDYTNYGNPGNPDWIVEFKDDKSQYSFNSDVILGACYEGEGQVIPFLNYLDENCKEDFVVCVVPRAKPHKSTHFREFIRYAIRHTRKHYELGHNKYEGEYDIYIPEFSHIIDGTDYIRRIKDTRTTHFSTPDGGDNPYPGITKGTCAIIEEEIRDKNVLLIDDIYTHHHRNPQTREKEFIGVCEDYLQALLDCGAKKVAFYAIAKTKQF
ncbi:hypothetical protein [Helicobacter sp. UBA3407]|uniref:hypothetical protein n=1 Tax=Helicobacter TaxID=209 RepID=UPI00261FEBCF|nr:hypothetical protein [Helicobacter sp. UBA3407]